jgi:UrcA family protein
VAFAAGPELDATEGIMVYAKILSLCVATAITAGGLFIFSPEASARPPIVVTAPDIAVRHVSYADLNLASLSGEKTLNRRVGSAVDSVCIEAVGSDTSTLAGNIANRRCNRGAWNGARPQIVRAVERARQIAATGSSTIAASAIVISIPE